MGRLEVRIRHGHDSGGPAVAALILFIIVGVAGAAHKQLAEAGHVIMTVIEIAAWTLASAAFLAITAGVTLATVKIRRALRARAHRVDATVISVTPARPGVGTGPRTAISPPHRTAGNWPLPGWWEEIRPHIGRDDDTTAGGTR